MRTADKPVVNPMVINRFRSRSLEIKSREVVQYRNRSSSPVISTVRTVYHTSRTSSPPVLTLKRKMDEGTNNHQGKHSKYDDNNPVTVEHNQEDEEGKSLVDQSRGKVTVIGKNGTEGKALRISSSICLFGRSRLCDIICIKSPADQHLKIKINEDGQAYLFDLTQPNMPKGGQLLKNGQKVESGGRFFKWNYPEHDSKDRIPTERLSRCGSHSDGEIMPRSDRDRSHLPEVNSMVINRFRSRSLEIKSREVVQSRNRSSSPVISTVRTVNHTSRTSSPPILTLKRKMDEGTNNHQGKHSKYDDNNPVTVEHNQEDEEGKSLDGAKQALQEWHYPGNKAQKKKRNKKKKPANDNSPHVNGDVSSAEIIPNGIVANGSIESDTEPVKTNSISDISSSVSSLSLLPTTCTVPSLTECDKVNHVAPTHTSQNSVSTQKHAKVNHVSPTNTSQNSVSTQKHAKVSHVSPAKTSQNSITTSRQADNSISSMRTADKPVVNPMVINRFRSRSLEIKSREVVQYRNRSSSPVLSTVRTVNHTSRTSSPPVLTLKRKMDEGTNNHQGKHSKYDDNNPVTVEHNQEDEEGKSLEQDVIQDEFPKKVLFSGPQIINYGFFKLFNKFQIAEHPEEATILVMPASENGISKFSTLTAFQCLLGRKIKIVNKRWIKDSVNHGEVQSLERYMINSFGIFGEYSLQENYQAFEFQMMGVWKEDMKEDEVRSMLQQMNGIEVLNSSENTIIVCADGHIHTSSKCVSKEWIFKSIIEGRIIREDEVNSAMEIVHDSDDESTLIGFQAFEPKKRIYMQTSGASSGKRLQKRQSCVYCDELSTKISRHLATKHKNELEVAKILNMKKKSKERRNAWFELASKGNFTHNMKVMDEGSGMLIPKYRPTENKKERKYLPCEYCRAHIVARDLWKHHQSCVSKPPGVRSDGPVQNSKLLLPMKCSYQLKHSVIKDLRDDVVAEKVRSDSLIMEFGQRKFDKTGKYVHTHQHIRDRMRELARFVIAMEEIDSSVKTLSQCITPTLWSSVLKAVKGVAGYHDETHEFSSPSLALKLGHSLCKTAKILRNKAIEKGDDITKERASLFLDLYKGEWGDRISSLALDSLSTAKYNSVQLLPLVEDVAKLSSFINREKQDAKQRDCQNNHVDTYARLCKLVLSEVILFNRKRSGEVQRLTKQSFLDSLLNPNVDEEIKKTLTGFEQQLCESHIRVETRGKRGRKIAILFTRPMKEDIEYLIELQKKLELQSQYIFVQPHSCNPYRGTHVLKDLAEQSDLEHPERITSTNLRKQLATVSQILGLSENHQDILAKFMGHDIRIHRDFYRLPQNTLEVAKVSKVLHLLNCGKISDIAGKSFDDIDVMEPVDFEEDEEEEEEIDDEIRGTRKTRKRGLHQSSDQQEEEEDDNSDDYEEEEDEEWKPPVKKRNRALISDDDDDEDEDDEPRTSTSVVHVAKKTGKRHMWTTEEMKCVEAAFRKNLSLKRLPGKKECQQLIDQNVVLHNRSWTMVKDFVRNKIVSMERKLHKLKEKK
ncbi:unnamed protein product [Mytilus coruscus]|uniref:BRCT domain-containing protein n=1 Tax=Mytilus coruscus TaxID=42192 RepID=A0A6J8DG31_MYTCO|nr:unnamed protein product [Mytilus coruscus]